MKIHHQLANPKYFMRFIDYIMPLSGILMVGFMVSGLYYALFNSPPDYQQGETVRIMYIHVPAAYMSSLIYAGMVLMSLFYIIWRHMLADLLARIMAPIGLIFTILCLITGSLWGKPMWGTWWVWDARLTSVFILFLIYCGYLIIRNAFDNMDRARMMAAILALFGGINLPIIKFSVDWWNTLHQPASLLTLQGPTIDSQILTPLLLMLAAVSFFSVFIVLLQAKAHILTQKQRHKVAS